MKLLFRILSCLKFPTKSPGVVNQNGVKQASCMPNSSKVPIDSSSIFSWMERHSHPRLSTKVVQASPPPAKTHCASLICVSTASWVFFWDCIR